MKGLKKEGTEKSICLIALLMMILIASAVISAYAQLNETSEPVASSEAERLKYWGNLLKQNLDEYARIRQDKTVRNEEIIFLIDNIVKILKNIRKIYEKQADSNLQRVERINSLIEVYEKKRLYHEQEPEK